MISLDEEQWAEAVLTLSAAGWLLSSRPRVARRLVDRAVHQLQVLAMAQDSVPDTQPAAPCTQGR
jgi:hypothetical protein